jgi:hypothetical protein
MKDYVELNGLRILLQSAFSGRTPHNFLLNIIAGRIVMRRDLVLIAVPELVEFFF